MDPPPPSDPPPQPQPPLSDQTTTGVIRPSGQFTASAPPPSQPSYTEMITAALTGLNELNGSSKQAIGKYIESNYANLPPTHAALLTDHLKMLKNSGELVMVKHSYKLSARSDTANPAAAAPTNGDVNNAVNPSDSVPKRRPGRPPKPKVGNNVEVQHAVPVFAPPANAVNVASSAQNVGPVGPDNASVAAGPEPVGKVNGMKRGRGRPRKVEGGAMRGPGRPPKTGGAGRGRPRGRPPKLENVVVAAPGMEAVPVVLMKQRGRPPKNAADGGDGGAGYVRAPKKQRRLSGKPLGRPRKNVPSMGSGGTSSGGASGGGTPDSQLLVAYLDLKAKYENLQARIRQTVTLIRPCLNDETALSALQELEIAGMMNFHAPAPPQPQAQPPAQPQFVVQPQVPLQS